MGKSRTVRKTGSGAGHVSPGRRPEQPQALLFELDHLAFPGRELLFDVLRRVIQEKEGQFTREHYVRLCLHPPIRRFAGTLLDTCVRKRLSPDRLASEVTEHMRKVTASSRISLDPGLKRLLAQAGAQGLRLGAISSYDAETAQAWMECLGLTAMGVVLVSEDEARHPAFSSDVWVSLAQRLKVLPGLCVALVSSAWSCKAVLASGMSCVVIPDGYTSFQDFAGADYVFESLDAEAIAGVLNVAVSA